MALYLHGFTVVDRPTSLITYFCGGFEGLGDEGNCSKSSLNLRHRKIKRQRKKCGKGDKTERVNIFIISLK